VRKLLALAAFAGSLPGFVLAQSPLTKVLASELDRNFTTLKQKGDPPPYFLGYTVTDSESDVIVAVGGAITSQRHSHNRVMDTTVRVGTPKFDNYRRVNGQIPRFTITVPLTLDDNPAAIQQTVWMVTDRVYKSAAQRMIQLKADDKLRLAAQDSSDDFSAEQPQVAYTSTPTYKINVADWSNRLRKLSVEFDQYAGVLNSSVVLQVERNVETIVTTEGTRIEQGRIFARILINARGKAADGMDLTTSDTFEADDPAKLPKDAELLVSVQKVGSKMVELLRAGPAEPFAGPAILSGRAAGVFFHEIFGHRIEGHRQKDESDGQTFTKSVGKAVLPGFLSVLSDPTMAVFEKTVLNGTYAYDDEGVKARRVGLVENGILKTFLMSRSPIDGFPNSNGHGRRQPGAEIVSRQANLIVDSGKKVSDQQLRQMLIDEIQRQKKPYGLYFEQVTGGFTTTQRRGQQAFTVIPLVVYRIYPDGRPDELIRGVDIVGTPLSSFASILATSDKSEVFNGICGAESGQVPVSAISPALLVSTIEVQNRERSRDPRPYLPRPSTTNSERAAQ
jgi:predicted Zn-dependent protease